MVNRNETDNDAIHGEPAKRDLHFIWMVDNSCSMIGAKIQTVNYAIKNVLPLLKDIESTQENVRFLMRTIKFGSSASWHGGSLPIPVQQFSWQDMDGNGGSTSTAQAIELLIDALDVDKIGARGAPPVVVLLSDGLCTDSEDRYNRAIEALNSLPWGRKAVRVSIGIGSNGSYDKHELDKFISPYLRDKDLETLPAENAAKLAEYIKLVSTQASIASASSGVSGDDKEATSPVQLDPAALHQKSKPFTGDNANTLPPEFVFD